MVQGIDGRHVQVGSVPVVVVVGEKKGLSPSEAHVNHFVCLSPFFLHKRVYKKAGDVSFVSLKTELDKVNLRRLTTDLGLIVAFRYDRRCGPESGEGEKPYSAL